MVVRTAKKTAPAKKAAAPARKAAPAAKPAPKAAPTKPVRKPAVGSEEKVTAYDVLRARKAADLAQQEVYRLETLFWKQNEDILQGAVEHAENFAEENTPPKRTGRKPAETPAAKVKAKTPNVAGEYFDKDETLALGLVDLRDLARELAENGVITETKVKKDIIAQMEAAGLFREAGADDTDEDDAVDDDEDSAEDEEAEDFDEEDDAEDDDDSEDDDDESDDEDDDEEDEGYSLDDLKAMKLKQLQELAEQNEIDWDGLSKAELIEEIWGDDEDEDEPEDDADEDDEEDEEEEETIEIDVTDLPNMSADELYALAKSTGVKVPVAKRKDKKFLVKKLEDELFPSDDEDDEE